MINDTTSFDIPNIIYKKKKKKKKKKKIKIKK